MKADVCLWEQNGGQMETADCGPAQDGRFRWLESCERADLHLGPFTSTRYSSYIRCRDNPDQRFHPVQLKGAMP